MNKPFLDPRVVEEFLSDEATSNERLVPRELQLHINHPWSTEV